MSSNEVVKLLTPTFQDNTPYEVGVYSRRNPHTTTIIRHGKMTTQIAILGASSQVNPRLISDPIKDKTIHAKSRRIHKNSFLAA